MQALHHRPIGAGEFEQPARERARDRKCVGHSLRIEPAQSSDRDRRSEWTRGARSVETAGLISMLRSAAYPDHYLGTSNEGGEEGAAAHALLLRDCERRRNQRRTRMDSTAGLGEIVELEGVSESTIGERCRCRAHGVATPVENETVATGAIRPCIR